jgi:RND family efflux transporter MFP subunit
MTRPFRLMKTALVASALFGAALLHSFSSVTATEPSTFEGVARASQIVHLGAAKDGLVSEVSVDRGSRVQIGQVLARLDQSVSEKEVALASKRAESTTSQRIVQARLADLQRRLEQQEGLLQKGIATPEDVDTIRTELKVEELNLVNELELGAINSLELRRASAALDQGILRSPINGIVLERFLSPGEVLSRGGQPEVVTLAQLDPLYIELHIPIEKFADIQLGESAEIQFDAPGSPKASATVTIKDHVVDTASRTFGVRLELANPNHLLPAGLRCQVTFEEKR